MTYLHHMLIHFPIALGILAFITSVVGVIRSDSFWRKATLYVLSAGAVFAIIAVATGLEAAEHWPAARIADHRNAALVAAVLFVAAGIWAAFQLWKKAVPSPKLLLLISVIVAFAIGFAAHEGGETVHPGLSIWSDEGHTHTHGIKDHGDNHRDALDDDHDEGEEHHH